MDGDVHCAPIERLTPLDLDPYVQVHLFAGIGGWPYALRLAGWPDSRPVWTGSCPCGPWSVAGKRGGTEDPRHLWPHFLRLIRAGAPPVVLGEQVAGPGGREWLAGVHADLEGAGYRCAAANLCAAGAGAPHVRQRYFWCAERVADAGCARVWGAGCGPAGRAEGGVQGADRERERFRADAGAAGVPDHDGVADPRLTRPLPSAHTGVYPGEAGARARDVERERRCLADPRLAHPNSDHSFWRDGPLQVGRNTIEGEVERGGRRHRAQWRVKSGLSLLADGVPHRVDRVRAFGNAISPQIAAVFVRAYMEAAGDMRGV